MNSIPMKRASINLARSARLVFIAALGIVLVGYVAKAVDAQIPDVAPAVTEALETAR